MTLKNLVAIAYDTWAEGQLVAPAWTEEFRFDIDAKVPSGAMKGDLLPMLRGMLADRFALRVRTQPKEVRGYELVVAKSGSKLAEAVPDGPVERSQPDAEITLDPNGFPAAVSGVTGVWIVENHARGQWRHVTTAQLAANLGTWAGMPINDATGLKGLYDISLYWVTDPRTEVEPSAPDLSQALQQQLGLKLQAAKVTIESVIVEHLEKVPTAN
jgi:uncharacterized protein (TIGR03435 family)